MCMIKIATPFMLYNLSLQRNKVNFVNKVFPNNPNEDQVLSKSLVKSKLNYKELSGVEKVYYNLIMGGKIKTCKELFTYGTHHSNPPS